MKTEKRKIGDMGERIAVDYLKNNNYRILETNFLKKWGEIDIIAKQNNEIVFVEVKTRIKTPKSVFFFPEANVNFAKKQKIIRTAETYLLQKNYPPEIIWRVDVIAIELNAASRKADLRHIKGIAI